MANMSWFYCLKVEILKKVEIRVKGNCFLKVKNEIEHSHTW